MNDLYIKVIAKAVAIRVANDEKLEDVIASYTKLTENDKSKLRELSKEG